ncbi:acyclic terpene utilization AtuA family protein [Xylophilus rhododendri]|uniref:Acyclic terpene utilization AtuA family protein n=2 Tax=Xylophilus rhododendri TaxID=2697032 RepID=A0A857JF41_9BURK|nr:acyclic terpene utilization AtuA family protein [Xylophilus rhododendri]
MMSASGILGYGFPEASLEAALARKPDMIGVDGGSSDPGPHYLGSGKTLNSRLAMKRDLSLLLRGAIRNGIPMMVGTCGGAGGKPHLEACADIIREVAREHGLSFRMALIHAEQDAAFIVEQLEAGKVRPLNNAPQIGAEDIRGAERIVGMMGPEPYRAALAAGAQVILGGRGTDPAPWVALAMHHGLPPAPAWYAGKMLECACNAAIPKKHDCLLVTVGEDFVEAEPLNPELRCTPLSVAVQALHENASPVIRHEPGGIVDSTDCRIEAVTERIVRITGMRWKPMPYSIKLEGARMVGYSAIAIAATRDPGLIGQIDSFLDFVRGSTATKVTALGISPADYQLVIRAYGRDGVMGAWEPHAELAPVELALIAEVVAKNQETANAALSLARVTLLHSDFPGRMCREGNMAFPFSPSDIERGAIYEFMLQHVVEIEDPLRMFPISYEDVGASA